MAEPVHFELPLGGELKHFRLPAGVQRRLQDLLDRQDAGQVLAVAERGCGGLETCASIVDCRKPARKPIPHPVGREWRPDGVGELANNRWPRGGA